MSYYEFEPKDFAPVTYVFKHSEEIEPFICKNCNHFDWYSAIKAGIPTSSQWPVRMPDCFCASSPPVYIVSKRFKEALESLAPNEAEFFPITGHPGNFMLLPKYIIWPPEEVIPYHSDPNRGAIFVAEGKSGIKCNICGQYPQIGIQTYKYILPEGINFGGIYLGVGFGFVFFASESIALALKKEKLTGLKLIKNGFAN